jgi:hypothetical protein
MTTIFDLIPRTDASPATPGETSFAFLNRVNSPYWQRVREFVETAFSAYSAENAADVRARFRDRLHVTPGSRPCLASEERQRLLGWRRPFVR